MFYTKKKVELEKNQIPFSHLSHMKWFNNNDFFYSHLEKKTFTAILGFYYKSVCIPVIRVLSHHHLMSYTCLILFKGKYTVKRAFDATFHFCLIFEIEILKWNWIKLKIRNIKKNMYIIGCKKIILLFIDWYQLLLRNHSIKWHEKCVKPISESFFEDNLVSHLFLNTIMRKKLLL